MDDENPLRTFKSHIEGKNAVVDVYPNRIEWSDKGRVTATRLVGKAITIGKVNARKATNTDLIPIKSVTAITTERDGLRFTKVRVVTAGNTIDFRVDRDEATSIKDLIASLMLGTHPSQLMQADQAQEASQSPTALPAPPLSAPPNSAGATAPPGHELTDRLAQLGRMHSDGLLSAEEFAAAKARLLG